MNPKHLSRWLSGSATVLMAALVATPLWDYWHYRGLRTGPGPGLAVGLILPPASPPRPALAAGLLPPSPVPVRPRDAAATGEASPRARTALADTGVATAPPAAAAQPPKAPATPEKPQASKGTPAIVPATTRASGGDRPAHAPATPAAGHPANAASAAPAAPGPGWLLAVAPAPQPDKPSLPPEPQPGPPPPHRLDPAPSVTDPRPVPQVLPVLSLGAPADDVAIGQDVIVNVSLSGARDVTSLPFHLQFDPAVVEFVSATQGAALSGSLQPVLLASVNPARPGDLAVGLSFIDAGGAFNGGGTILSLQFRALASGVSPLAFDRASVRGLTSQPLQAQFESASIRVR